MWYHDKSYVNGYSKAMYLAERWEDTKMMSNDQLELELSRWEEEQRNREAAKDILESWYHEVERLRENERLNRALEWVEENPILYDLSKNKVADDIVELLDKVLYELKWSSGNKDLIKKIKYNMINTNRKFNKNHITLLTLMENL